MGSGGTIRATTGRDQRRGLDINIIVTAPKVTVDILPLAQLRKTRR